MAEDSHKKKKRKRKETQKMFVYLMPDLRLLTGEIKMGARAVDNRIGLSPTEV